MTILEALWTVVFPWLVYAYEVILPWALTVLALLIPAGLIYEYLERRKQERQAH
jgi:hypothetical protein